MKRYIYAGLFVFFGGLLVTFPARVAFNWFAPADVHVSGISGSVWNGSAIEAMATGAYIQDISWRFKPGSIFSGALAFEISGKPASGTLDADVAVSFGGTLTFSKVSGGIPLDLIHPAIQQNGISGDVSLNFDEVVIRNGLPVVAIGSITIRNLFAPDLSSSRLGDYKAEFQITDGNITATIADLSGVLDVSGTITLSPQRNYQLIGEVAARPDAPSSIKLQLQYLGSPDERGFRPFRFEGTL
jgi:general secretion pathway protein N